MIAAWMLWSTVVAGLLGGGSAALERALIQLGRPVRWVWLAALAAALAIPAGLWFPSRGQADPAPAAPVPAGSASAGAIPPGAGAATPPADATETVEVRREIWLGREVEPVLPGLDRPLLLAWGAVSAGLLLVFAGFSVALRLRRRRWRAEMVDGRPVLVSPATGPAVVGLVRSAIVLPEWALRLPPEARELILAHEEEHLRAGDPRLLLAGIAAAVAMPWNPVVWLLLRQLRLAMEVDCDRRVLRRSGDVAAYGRLLLEMGRRGPAGPLAVAALSEPASFLERRIRVMTQRPLRASLARTGGLCTLAAVALVAALHAPRPAPLYAAPGGDASRAAAGLSAEQARLRQTIATHFPRQVKADIGRHVDVALLVDAQGRVVDKVWQTRAMTVRVGELPAVEVPDAMRPLQPVGELLGHFEQLRPEEIARVRESSHPAGQLARAAMRVAVVELKPQGARVPAAPSLAAPAAADTAARRITAIFGGARLDRVMELVSQHAGVRVAVGAGAAALPIDADWRELPWPVAVRGIASTYGLCVNEERGVPVRIDTCPGAPARDVVVGVEEVRRVAVTVRIAREDSILYARRHVMRDGQRASAAIQNVARGVPLAVDLGVRFTPQGTAYVRAILDRDAASEHEYIVRDRGSLSMQHGDYTVVLDTEVLRTVEF